MEPYRPEDLPLHDLDLQGLVGRVGRANAALARYDGLVQGLVNPEILLSPLTTQEAVLSSKIEGTQATLDEVLEHEAGQLQQGEKAQDVREIINYRTALALAREVVADQPISLWLLRQVHRVLMDSVRGQDKAPGEFRKDQNWIGRPGCPIEEATFVPPNPMVMADYLQAWEAYVQGEDVDVLIQLALVHAQFELIHPFKDGNGRIGRLLIPLFLYQKRVLSSPSFYLSQYLDAHRDAYYDRLQAISRDGDWNGWVAFFLDAVISQSGDNGDRVRKMLELYERMKLRIVELTHSQHALAALDTLFHRPIFQTSDFVERSAIPKQTAFPMLRALRGAGILIPVREASGRRAAILAFPELLNIVEGRPVLPQPQP